VRRQIQKLFDDEISPALAAHGGFIELVDVANNKVYVKLGGGCHGCGMAQVTLKDGVERILKERFPAVEEVVDATDHSTAENPFMSAGE